MLFVSHLLVLYPTLVANCSWWGPVVTHFETPRREVWLTIDDGPDAIHTPRMLELLARFDAAPLSSPSGKRLRRTPAELAQIRAAGHEIANHTFSHPSGSFWAYFPAAIAREIDRHPVLFRLFPRAGGAEKLLRPSRAREARNAADRLDRARTRHRAAAIRKRS